MIDLAMQVIRDAKPTNKDEQGRQRDTDTCDGQSAHDSANERHACRCRKSAIKWRVELLEFDIEFNGFGFRLDIQLKATRLPVDVLFVDMTFYWLALHVGRRLVAFDGGLVFPRY